jgi:glycosyltransferase involved in cell wall biosynthesis
MNPRRLDTAAGVQNRPDDQPLVSIVMPCFNNEAYVAEAIESALGQSYANIEVIVIDDGSTDGSLDIIRSYEGRIVWRTGPNEGACAARNKGLALARGQFVKFFDADDLLHGDCIATQVRHYSKCSAENEIVVGGHALIDANGHPLPGRKYANTFGEGDAFDFSSLLRHGPLTSEPLHRTDFIRRIGGFNVAVERGQEHELHLRAFAFGAIFIFYPAVCYYYRIHSSGDRISVAVPHKHYFASSDAYLALWRDLTRQLATVPDEIRTTLAQDAWRRGRLALRKRQTERANRLFRAAAEICPEGFMLGSGIYKHICRVTGPQVAEWLARFVNPLRRIRLASNKNGPP